MPTDQSTNPIPAPATPGRAAFAARCADDPELRAAVFDAAARLGTFCASDDFRILRLQQQAAWEQRMARLSSPPRPGGLD